jgi:predicted component of type VI protein secretion system
LPEEQAKAYLQEVFQDLTLHQLGLMAGFRECVRGLLKEFDPVLLANEGKGESTGKGLGLLGGKSARTDAAAWQRFLKKYRQLTEEEVRVFEQILAPHFAKGYLSIQKTRRRK